MTVALGGGLLAIGTERHGSPTLQHPATSQTPQLRKGTGFHRCPLREELAYSGTAEAMFELATIRHVPVRLTQPPAVSARMIWSRLHPLGLLSILRATLLARYGVTAVLAALALWLAVISESVLGGHVFALFISVVMISAWNGGLGPGLLGTLLGLGSINYFFQEPRQSLGIPEPAAALQLLVFLFAAVLISSLSNNLRAARQRADEARAQLEQRGRQREQVIQSITHDLRTPLTVIHACAALIKRRTPALASNDRPLGDLAQHLSTIETTSVRMSALLNELLDAARLEAGHPLTLRRVQTDLVLLCRNKAAEYAVVEPRRQIVVETTQAELVGWWDGPRLERVLENLLSNALKYGEPASDVIIQVDVETSRGARWAVLRVQDHGPGIAARDLPFLFERFFRGSSTADRIGGTGLGLAGTRDIVELHGGSISADSEVGRGSVFTVRLPTALESS